MPHAAAPLVRGLYLLRWFAVAGQSLAIVLATGPLHLPLRAPMLWAAVVVLAAFNLAVAVRLRRRREPGPAEACGHVLVDTAALAWLVAWSGGIANPFASLFLLPVALAALALPLRWSVAAAATCVAGYLAAVLLARPLPQHVHADSLDLHLAGMALNFLLSVAVVAFFLTRLAAARERAEHELALLRERFARNEGIVALATHAASVAHELNTPLATMALLLDEIDPRTLPAGAAGDLASVRRLVDTCSERVRSLADPADPARTGSVVLGKLLDQWTLMRPATTLVRAGDAPADLRLDRALGHLLLVLLNNAADAGEANGRPRIELELRLDGDRLHGSVRDHGPGLEAQAPLLPVLFRSTKPDGLGVGLVLSHAAMERLGGTLAIADAPGGGACVRFDVPRANAVPRPVPGTPP